MKGRGMMVVSAGKGRESVYSGGTTKGTRGE